MLAVGTLYLGHYQKNLIENKLNTFKTEVELISIALSEQPDSSQMPDNKARLIKLLSQTLNQRIYLFSDSGELVADSLTIPGSYESVFGPAQIPVQKKLGSIQILKDMAGLVISFLPERKILPLYPQDSLNHATGHPNAMTALDGNISMSAWRDSEKNIFLTVAAPLYKNGKILGAVLVARNGQDIEEDIGSVWISILQIFSVTLLITIIISIYLSGTIAAPLRKLAAAAEILRKGGESEIPDFSKRRDEIGELSLVMREMAQALWDRMDSIDRFAADVTHELKNPLASLKSAIETAAIVKDDKDRAQLMKVIAHDVERMDRLITDISTASRLDAELSRENMEPVSLRKILLKMLENIKLPQERNTLGSGNARFKTASHDVYIEFNNLGENTTDSAEDSIVWGRETRLVQVFENLVSNALSFSPPGGTVYITIVPVKKRVVVTVEDQGPGIPENRLETVFERFYTERPRHEDYGRHSGLGLSISKHIIDALGGHIFAENIKDQNQKITGARFTVILGRA
jgi:two-component system sensor histidine kinase ChvG